MKRSLIGRIGKTIAYLLLMMVIVTAVDVWRSQDLPTEVAALGTMTTLAGDEIDLAAMSTEQPVLVHPWSTWWVHR